MNVSGEFTVNAPRDVVFKTLRDPSSFVRFVDGVSDLKEIDPTHYEAVFETRVAYLKFKFNVTVEVTRIDEPSVIEAKIEGNAARRGRPPDRQVDHHGSKRPATRPRSPIRSNRRSPASSAASASRCCAPRPRTWKRYSRNRLRAAFADNPAGG